MTWFFSQSVKRFDPPAQRVGRATNIAHIHDNFARLPTMFRATDIWFRSRGLAYFYNNIQWLVLNMEHVVQLG